MWHIAAVVSAENVQDEVEVTGLGMCQRYQIKF